MKASVFAATIVALTAFGAIQAKADDVIVVPGEVDTYVSEQPYDDTVVYEDDVVVGEPLPDQVVIRRIPDNDDYGYVVTNKRRVIVEPQTIVESLTVTPASPKSGEPPIEPRLPPIKSSANALT